MPRSATPGWRSQPTIGASRPTAALIAAALAQGDGASALRLLDECDGMLAELGIAAGEQTEMLRRRLATPRRLTA